MKSATLPKSERLKKSDFKILFREGKRIRGKLFSIQAVNRKESVRRVSFAAHRRVGNAVMRNKAKRMLREAYRMKKNRYPKEFDIVLIAERKILSVDVATVEVEMARLLSEI